MAVLPSEATAVIDGVVPTASLVKLNKLLTAFSFPAASLNVPAATSMDVIWPSTSEFDAVQT